uniref:Integrase catalytic domain-containing protein n=1 Tax=Heligmosomoides polygyrus TaxID=6339 RepID=A0A183GFI4_HELPZ
LVTPPTHAYILHAAFAEEIIIDSSAEGHTAGTDPPVLQPETDAAAVENAVVATTTDIDLRDGTLREVHPTTTVDNVNDRTIVDHVRHPETGTHRTDIVLVDSLGKKLKLELITKEVVTLAQRPPRLHQEDVDFIRHHGFELPLCREDNIVPDILIGIDHYWDIICPEAPICLPTGMVLCHTCFGTVISGNSVFRCLRTCITCKKFNAVPYRYPDVPPLPPERTQRSRPFQNVGLDYLGPHACTGTSSGKVWICLITCMTTRAIHLEVVLDNTTQEFLFAFRRFIARRGAPDVVYSDNSTTFHAAETAITALLYAPSSWRNVSTFCASHKIKWNFITPLSPWKGGFYERLVALFKSAYKKSIGRNVLPLNQLQTVVVEVEATLNSRPITPFREKDTFIHVLRPVDFLIPQVELQLPPLPPQLDDLYDSSHNLASWYKSTLSILDHFWKLWQSDYLSALRERHRATSKRPKSTSIAPEIGDVVLVADENAPRGSWTYGLIVQLNPGQDGSVRTAEVRTPNGRCLKRSLSHLYPLEIHANSAITPPQDSTPPSSAARVQPQRRAKSQHAFINPHSRTISPP